MYNLYIRDLKISTMDNLTEAFETMVSLVGDYEPKDLKITIS